MLRLLGIGWLFHLKNLTNSLFFVLISVVAVSLPIRRTRGELMGVWTALSHVDVESIGAGGGSLGWVDARGMLRVGPRSAGARWRWPPRAQRGTPASRPSSAG